MDCTVIFPGGRISSAWPAQTPALINGSNARPHRPPQFPASPQNARMLRASGRVRRPGRLQRAPKRLARWGASSWLCEGHTGNCRL